MVFFGNSHQGAQIESNIISIKSGYVTVRERSTEKTKEMVEVTLILQISPF